MKKILKSGVGLMVGSVVTSKVGALAPAETAGIQSNVQSGFQLASVGNVVQGAGMLMKQVKKLGKR